MERCPVCDAELPAVAYYCPICGQKLETPREPAATPAIEDTPPPAAAPEAWRVTSVTGVQMIGPALMAGIAAGVLLGVPGTAACGMLWMIGCGALAVYFFHKQFGRAALPNEAARLGLISGFVGFLVAVTVAFLAFGLIRRAPFGLIDHLTEYLRKSADMLAGSRPHDATQIQRLLASSGGAALILATLAAFYFFFFLALSTLGALLAGMMSRRR